MQLVTRTTITALSPIQGAERIETATVLGWSAVVRKGEFQVGEEIIFVFPDTFIPKKYIDSSAPPDEKVRLKTIRLRGQYSAGLILKAALGEGIDHDKLSEHLGIEKYEPPVPPCLAGTAIGSFPTHLVPKTDEDNYRSNPGVWDELNEARFLGVDLILTTKYDGTSATYIHNEQTINKSAFRVCSRNLELTYDAENTYWKIADKYKIHEKLQALNRYVAIQGEIVGEGIQGNNIGIKGQEFYIFLVKDLVSGEWLSWDDTKLLAAQLGIPTVPEVARFSEIPTKESLQEMVNALKYPSGSFVEGGVLRTAKPIHSNVLAKSWWSVKIMNEPYDSKKGGNT